MYQVKDFFGCGDKHVRVVCGSGKEYWGEYVDEYRCVFFAIPSDEKILGYELI